jgi:hypothetical protein
LLFCLTRAKYLTDDKLSSNIHLTTMLVQLHPTWCV